MVGALFVAALRDLLILAGVAAFSQLVIFGAIFVFVPVLNYALNAIMVAAYQRRYQGGLASNKAPTP
jgi:predicted ABC-type sugar transport system permease subunit